MKFWHVFNQSECRNYLPLIANDVQAGCAGLEAYPNVMARRLLLSVYCLVFLAAFVDSCSFNGDCSSPFNFYCGAKCTNVDCPWTTNCFHDSDCSGAMRCCVDTGYCRIDLNDCPLVPGAIVVIVFGVL